MTYSGTFIKRVKREARFNLEGLASLISRLFHLLARKARGTPPPPLINKLSKVANQFSAERHLHFQYVAR